MIFTWPVLGSFNIAFGEMSVLLGIVFIGASIALAQNWELITVTIYAFFAGMAAILVGLRIINLGVTTQPILSGLGFILSGLGGVCATPALLLRTNRTLRLIGTIVLVAAALIWALMACVTYWGHLDKFSNWVPYPMRWNVATHPRSAMIRFGNLTSHVNLKQTCSNFLKVLEQFKFSNGENRGINFSNKKFVNSLI